MESRSKFRVKLPLLDRQYEAKKDELIDPSCLPVSDICKHCWYQSTCIRRTLFKDPPRTCCVFQMWNETPPDKVASIQLSDVVDYCCENACVQRQAWEHDPVPHNTEYCSKHCPVSGFILGRPKSNYSVNG